MIINALRLRIWPRDYRDNKVCGRVRGLDIIASQYLCMYAGLIFSFTLYNLNLAFIVIHHDE